MEAKVVAEIMISMWIPRFGIPQMVISDRAKNFTGKILGTIYKALQVEVNLTAAYNPSANGLCEQVNRNISNLLRVMLEDGVDDWPKKLNILFSAYNATPQTSTGYSPNFLVYGRELVEPLDTLLYRDGIHGVKQQKVLVELEQRLALRRKALHTLAVKAEQRYEKVRTQIEESQPVEKFVVGEQVGFRAPDKGNKLKKAFEINHRVIKVLTTNSYVIKNMENGFERVVNVRKMRKIGKRVECEEPNTVTLHVPNTSEFTDEENDDSNPAGDDSALKEERQLPEENANEEESNAPCWGRRLRDRNKLSKPDRLQL